MNAVGYIRVSTDEQVREGVSLDNQRERIKAFAYAKGWSLEEIYEDPGYSGKNLKRPGIERLIQDAKKGLFDAVIVYKVDRLTRKQKDLWNLIEEVFESNGIGFISVNEPFDTTSAIGKACLGMIGVFAQLERDIIAERTKDALRYKKENGERLGAPSLGFQVIDGEAIENKDEIETLHYIKTLRLEGLTYRAIADRLNEEEIPTKKGGKWYNSTVQYIIKNLIPRLIPSPA